MHLQLIAKCGLFIYMRVGLYQNLVLWQKGLRLTDNAREGSNFLGFCLGLFSALWFKGELGTEQMGWSQTWRQGGTRLEPDWNFWFCSVLLWFSIREKKTFYLLVSIFSGSIPPILASHDPWPLQSLMTFPFWVILCFIRRHSTSGAKIIMAFSRSWRAKPLLDSSLSEQKWSLTNGCRWESKEIE